MMVMRTSVCHHIGITSHMALLTCMGMTEFTGNPLCQQFCTEIYWFLSILFIISIYFSVVLWCSLSTSEAYYRLEVVMHSQIVNACTCTCKNEFWKRGCNLLGEGGNVCIEEHLRMPMVLSSENSKFISKQSFENLSLQNPTSFCWNTSFCEGW